MYTSLFSQRQWNLETRHVDHIRCTKEKYQRLLVTDKTVKERWSSYFNKLFKGDNEGIQGELEDGSMVQVIIIIYFKHYSKWPNSNISKIQIESEGTVADKK